MKSTISIPKSTDNRNPYPPLSDLAQAWNEGYNTALEATLERLERIRKECQPKAFVDPCGTGNFISKL